MSKRAITTFSNLKVDPTIGGITSQDDIFYPPILTTEERDKLTDIGTGGIIFNSTAKAYQGMISNHWQKMTFSRCGTVDVGDIQGGAVDPLPFTGDLTSAKKDDVEQGSVVTITYEDYGYAPIIMLSNLVSDITKDNVLYAPVIKSVSNNTAEITLIETAEVQNVTLNVLLLNPNT